MNILRPILIAALPITASAIGHASTPQSYTALDRASEAACLRAANLAGARVGPSMRFSDRLGVDIRTVTGAWRQPHMRGAQANMLCLFDRRTRRAEVQEMAHETTPALPAGSGIARDVFWRAVEIDGRPVVGSEPVTVYFGSDGRIAGKSGCNNYSARYRMSGADLTVYPPLVGTRMACPPAIMKQEQRFQDILQRVRAIQPGPRGNIVLTTSERTAIMLVRH